MNTKRPLRLRIELNTFFSLLLHRSKNPSPLSCPRKATNGAFSTRNVLWGVPRLVRRTIIFLQRSYNVHISVQLPPQGHHQRRPPDEGRYLERSLARSTYTRYISSKILIYDVPLICSVATPRPPATTTSRRRTFLGTFVGSFFERLGLHGGLSLEVPHRKISHPRYHLFAVAAAAQLKRDKQKRTGGSIFIGYCKV